jgi:uncharacterized repeat protein (TIGR02543 family)
MLLLNRLDGLEEYMSKNLCKILILVIACVAMLTIFTACGNNTEIESIAIAEGQETTYTVSDFSVSYIKFIVVETDGDTYQMSVSNDYLSSTDKDQLSYAGTKTITINYQNKTTTFSFVLTDAAGGDNGGTTVEENYITVSFNTNGGSPSAIPAVAMEDSVTVTEDDALVASISKSGCEFGGWYTEATFQNKVSFPFVSTTDRVLYAKWTPFVVDVVLDVMTSEVSLDKTVYQTDVKLLHTRHTYNNRKDGIYL